MEQSTARDNLSTTSKRLIGGGIGIILLWGLITYVPTTIASFAAKEPGKTIVFYAQVFLFIGSLAAVIVICSLIFSTRKFKIEEIKIFGAKITISGNTQDAINDE